MPKDNATTIANADLLRRTSVPFSALQQSKLNPRKTFDAEKIATLADSMLAEGILQNLTVRQGSKPGTYEIVAGEYRYRAVAHLVAAKKVDDSFPVPVLVRDLDDADVLTLAMAENMARRDMTPLEEAYGFQELRRRKIPTADIAARVGVTQRTVQQRLALLDKLAPETIKALEKGEINVTQARALTLGDKKMQKELVAEIKDRRKYDGDMTEAQIKEQITEDAIDAKDVIFDPKLYTGDTRIDEDAGITYFTDVAMVRKLTEAAIESKLAELKKKWPTATILDARKDQYFLEHQWEQKPKDPAATAILVIHHDGSADVHEGLIPAKVAQARKQLAAAGAADKTAKRLPSDSFTSTHRAQAHRAKTFALQRGVMADPAIAMRLVLAAALSASGFDPVLISIDGHDLDRKFDKEARLDPSLAAALGKHFAKAKDGKLKASTKNGVGKPASYVANGHAQAAAIWTWLGKLKGKELETLFAAVIASRVGTWFNGLGQLADAPEAVMLAQSLGIAGKETEHGLGLAADQLDGLRRDALYAICKKLKVQNVSESTSRDTLVASIEKRLKDLGKNVSAILPTLRFADERTMLKSVADFVKG